MPHFMCCVCERRIVSNASKNRIGQANLKEYFEKLVVPKLQSFKTFNFEKDMICQKCHAVLRNQIKKHKCDPSLIDEDLFKNQVKRRRKSNDFEELQQDQAHHSSRSDCTDDLQFNLTDGELERHVKYNEQVKENNFVQNDGRLLQIMALSSSQKTCCICGSKNNRKRIPKPAIMQVWLKKNILIPHLNRCCAVHLSENVFKDDVLEAIVPDKTEVVLTDEYVTNWIFDLSRIHNGPRRRFNFDDVQDVANEDYEFLVGLNKDNFDQVLITIKNNLKNSKNRSPRNALAIFLMMLRHNLTQTVLANLFGILNQSVISQVIHNVADSLELYFVPKYLGLEHLKREDALQNHSRTIFNEVFQAPPETLFLVMDGTYVYIEKPGDFALQKKTFSGQKKRNLVKPFMIVLPSGYILEAAGPFYANGKNNDAGILHSLLNPRNSDLSKYLKRNDHVVVDRGFRDVIEELKSMEIKVHMPSLKNSSIKQFETTDANSSRLVTICRWVVEAVNGRIKKRFKFFQNVVPGGYLEKINIFFKIACALINAFCDCLLNNEEKHKIIASKVLALKNTSNVLQARVIEEKLDRKTKKWCLASSTMVSDFPKINIEELKLLTLGTYQLKLAKRYSQLHIDKNNEDYNIFLNNDVPGIVRIKLESRFSSKAHHLWIEYKNENSVDGIISYYCKCMQGARTIGCCAHIASVIWYLSSDRHLECKTVRARKNLKIFDAGAGAEANDIEEAENN